MIGRVGLGELLEAARGGPVELAGIDNDAADGGAVAAEEFGRRVDDDVGAPLDGPNQRWRRGGVVDDERQPFSWAMAASFSMSAMSSLGLPRVSV